MIDDAFGHWLAGFIDGEGCFFVQRLQRHGGGLTPVFSLTLGIKDRDILDLIVEQTGIGKTYHQRKPSPSQKNGKSSWRIVKKEDLEQFVMLLERCPLRAIKRDDFLIWRRAVKAYIRDGWRSPELLRCRTELSQKRPGLAAAKNDRRLMVVR